MSKLPLPSTACALFSMDTRTAVIDVIASSRSIVIDLQATSFATDGRARDTHSFLNLSLDDATRLQAIIGQAIDVLDGGNIDPRQTALWSNATFLTPVRRAMA